MRGPGIPSDTICSELIATIDLLPTFASILKSSLRSRKIDGMDMKIYYLQRENLLEKSFSITLLEGRLRALDKGNGNFCRKEKQKQEWLVESLLFDLSNDIGEANNLASDRPGLVQKLNNRMTLLDSEIAKNARVPWTTP